MKGCVHSLALSTMEEGEGWRDVCTHWHYLQWRRGRGEGVCALIVTIYNGGGGGVKGCVHSLSLSTMEEGEG